MSKRTKFLVKLAVFAVIIVALAFLRQYFLKLDGEAEKTSGIAYAEMVADNNPLLIEFKTRYPDRSILLACTEDITRDDIKDLVVISQLGSEINIIVLYSANDGEFRETEPIPAPRENQHIRFFNMDNVGEIEVLITGEKAGQVGYAIFRVIDGKLVNLFGEGMEDCC